MAKGWRTIAEYGLVENKTRDRRKAIRVADTLMRTTDKLNADKLKEEGVNLFYAQKAEDDHLLDAFDNKRIKKKDAIKRALRLKKEREKSKNAKQQNAQASIKEEPTESFV